MTTRDIRAKGIGRDSKRHDLDDRPKQTPGLQNSSLQSGDVQELERGQQVVQQTRPTPTQATGSAAGSPTQPTGAPMAVPDPIAFAQKKLAGTANDGFAGGRITLKDNQQWMPFLERLAMSPTSSGILQRAFITKLSATLAQPTGGAPAVVRQRDLDDRLREFNER